MGSFLPHIFLAYCILSYCVVFYACSSMETAMALKRVAHTRGNNVCFRYGDRTLVRPFLMPLGTSRLYKLQTTLFFSITLVHLCNGKVSVHMYSVFMNTFPKMYLDTEIILRIHLHIVQCYVELVHKCN